MMERSEVYCTNCRGQFIQELDLGLNGNHRITCPLCRHIHYRVVENGVVTEDRWASSSNQTPVFVATTYASTTSTDFRVSNITSGSYLTTGSLWINRTDITFS